MPQFAHLLNQKLNIIFWQVECNISVLFSAFIVIVVFQFLLAKQQLNFLTYRSLMFDFQQLRLPVLHPKN